MALKIDKTFIWMHLHCKLLTILNIIFTAIDKKSILYITHTNLEKRMSRFHTSILLKLGGPLQPVVVLVFLYVNIYCQYFSGIRSGDILGRHTVWASLWAGGGCGYLVGGGSTLRGTRERELLRQEGDHALWLHWTYCKWYSHDLYTFFVTKANLTIIYYQNHSFLDTGYLIKLFLTILFTYIISLWNVFLFLIKFVK